MCLQVAFVVNNKRKCRVMKAWKRLRQFGAYEIKYETPYTNVVVPVQGLLMPPLAQSRVRTFHKDMEIHGGFIHSFYTPMSSDASGHRISGHGITEFTAFAIGVVAWGDSYSHDQASRALYIPECDRDKNRRARRVKLLSSKKMPTVKQLVVEFPELKKIAHLL